MIVWEAGVSAIVMALVIIFFTLIIWQIVTKRDSSTELKRISEMTATILFWVVIITAVVLVIVYGS